MMVIYYCSECGHSEGMHRKRTKEGEERGACNSVRVPIFKGSAPDVHCECTSFQRAVYVAS